ncbi:MAG: hypothetical protein RLZZ77_315 [Bacteroidota bacterium]|jgi:hypothetical protein
MKKLFFLFSILLLASCKQEEGVGGNHTITGTVWVKNYNSSFTQLLGEYAGKDTYVYIVYGDHQGYDKRIKTDYKGQFTFEFLYPGDYTVYTYSLDSTLTDLSGFVPVVQSVTLEGRKGETTLEPLIIFE